MPKASKKSKPANNSSKKKKPTAKPAVKTAAKKVAAKLPATKKAAKKAPAKKPATGDETTGPTVEQIDAELKTLEARTKELNDLRNAKQPPVVDEAPRGSGGSTLRAW